MLRLRKTEKITRYSKMVPFLIQQKTYAILWFMAIPDNKTFVEQTADYLRQHILSGRWGLAIPAERELAGELQVARNTLRKAIRILSEEGLLYVPEGQRRHCIAMPAGGVDESKVLSRVALLTNTPLEKLPSHTLLRADLMRRALVSSKIEFKVLTSRAFRMARPTAALQELMTAHPGCMWILHHATEPVQRWFKTEGIPCVVFGTSYPGIDLPSFSIDLAASMRHAMGLLRQQGHTSMVLVEPEMALAGHLRVRSVMEEQAVNWDSARSLVWDGDQTAFPVAVKAMMNSDHPPTAFILMDASHTIALYSTFCHIGMRIPTDASVVALFDDPFLDRIVPKLAHYRENAEVEAKRMITLVRQALRGVSDIHTSSLLQEFVPGGTIAPPPSQHL